ncbi:hypothetical protein A5727_01045 [Mycobacterium sp. ACS4331]|nr:hypothetical protein A5727_01045 [Mycobacterium sp. ACS4331]
MVFESGDDPALLGKHRQWNRNSAHRRLSQFQAGRTIHEAAVVSSIEIIAEKLTIEHVPRTENMRMIIHPRWPFDEVGLGF